MTNSLDLTSAISGAVTNIGTQLTSIAPTAIEIGAAVFVLFFGWKLVKRMAK